ncbi:PAS domain S-box protein [Litoribacter alkaliphilus]|uniref:histidine kinase n=1 Tax=Litoribacter ruber TaxID=702568 RepID=A0AAP2G1X5_9BACT|nr:PAS domain S-box protein [Litoribacter alkaliphilus]MBS9525304.1 PAS domain S-box protein [Litoribacter alkaliphilus]
MESSIFQSIDIAEYFDKINDPLFIFSESEVIYFNNSFKNHFESLPKSWEQFFKEPNLVEELQNFFNGGNLPSPQVAKDSLEQAEKKSFYIWEFVKMPSKEGQPLCMAKGRKKVTFTEILFDHLSQESEEVKRSEVSLIHNILRNSHDMIAILDKNGIFRYISPATVQILGYDLHEVIGKSFMYLVKNGFITIEKGNFEDLDDSEKEIEIDFWIKTKDGKNLFLESFGKNLLNDPEINGLLFSARDITAIKKSEKSLKKRYELEQLINRISARFVNSDVKNFDEVFNEALRLIGKFEKADRSYIFLVHQDLKVLENVYEWTADGVEPQIEYLKELPYSEEEIIIQGLLRRDITVIPDIEKLSDRYMYEKEIYRQQGIKSLMVIPIFSEHQLIGFFGLDAVKERREWHANDEYVLRQLGDVFAGSFINRSIKVKLERNENLLASTELLAKSGSWRFSNTKKRIYFSKGLNNIFELDENLEYAKINDFFKLVSPKVRMEITTNVKRSLKYRESSSGEFSITAKGGGLKHITYSIQVKENYTNSELEIFGYCRDITSKKNAEKNLLLQSQILAQVNDAIFVTDKNLRVIYMNQSADKGYSTDDFEENKTTLSQLISVILPNSKKLEELKIKVDENGSWVGEVEIETKQGRFEPHELAVNPFKDDEGKPIGYSFLAKNLTFQKNSEEIAKKSRLIIENSPAVLFTLDPNENFRINFITDNISQFGYNAEEVVRNQTSILDFIHPDDAKELLHYHKSNTTDTGVPSFSGEYRFRTADGAYRWVEDRTREIYDKNGKILLHEGLFQDVTERKKHRLEIERNEKRYRVLASNIPFTNVFLIDKNLKYIVAEGPNFKYWGMDSGTFEGKTIYEVHTTNLEKIEPVVEAALKKRRTVQETITLLSRVYELTAKPIIAGDEVEYILGIVRDITEEYRVKQDLQRSEEKYRNLVEESTEIIFSLGADLELTYISPNVKQFLGYEPHEVTSASLNKFLHPEDTEVFVEKMKENDIFFQDNQYLEFRLVHKKGEYRIFSANGKVIKDQNGKFKYYTGIARDISKLKEAQRELYIAKEKAEQASMVKSQFLSIMSHEIRTPMNAVIGMSHLLIEEDPRQDQLENLRTLQFSAENLLGLINDILDYSKIESGKIELEHVDFEPRNVLNRMMHSHTFQAREKSLEIIAKVDNRVPEILNGDPVRLGQIINNLISNAIKFTEKGHVKISLSNIGETDDKVTVRFMFEDTGIGIDEDKKDIIFEAFTQASTETTRKFGGTGLGLAIVKKLVELFDSRIVVQSQKGRGTLFMFDIEFNKYIKKSIVHKDSQDSSVKNLTQARILVAEDNLVNQIMIRKFLTKWEAGHVEFANDGVEALKLFEAGDFNLILLDLQMPEMDGFEVAKVVRSHPNEQKRTIPIIALTASSLIEVKDQLDEVGMDDYIPKPFNPDNLYARMIKYLQK